MVASVNITWNLNHFLLFKLFTPERRVREKNRKSRKHNAEKYGFCKMCKNKEKVINKVRYSCSFLLFNTPVTMVKISSKNVTFPSI